MTGVPFTPGTELVLPGTGQVIDLANPGSCADALNQIRQLEQSLRDAKRVLTEMLVAESERQGTKTLRLGKLEAIVGGGYNVTWDIEELAKLQDLGLPEERYYDLVQTVISYKVNASVAKQIAGANPDYARIIENARGEEPAAYRVSLK